MIDNRLYQTHAWTQKLKITDETSVEVRKFEIRTLLKEQEVYSIFEYSSARGNRTRRVLLPMIQFDENFNVLGEGEEAKKFATFSDAIDDRMRTVVESVYANGMGVYSAEHIKDVPGSFVHYHMFFAGSEAHLMGFLPHFDEMNWHFMVRSEIVPAGSHPQ